MKNKIKLEVILLGKRFPTNDIAHTTAVKKLILTFSLLTLSTLALFARAGGGERGWDFLFRTPFGWAILLIFGVVAFLIFRFRVVRTKKRLARFADLDSRPLKTHFRW